MSTWDHLWLSLLLLTMVSILAKLASSWLVHQGWLTPRYRLHALLLIVCFLVVLGALSGGYDDLLRTRKSSLSESLLPSVEEAVHEAEQRILALRQSCGSLCPSSSASSSSSSLFTFMAKDLDCEALSEDHSHELVSSTFWSEVPRHISPELLSSFSYGGVATLSFDYKSFDLTPSQDWSAEDVEMHRRSATPESLSGDALKVLKVLQTQLKVEQKHVLVFTMDEKPVVEGMLLALGASSIVTVDHRGISSHHEQVHVMHPAALPRLYSHVDDEGHGTFDIVIAVMSLQSLGMGRYGDGLHPWKDLVTLARAWCVTRNDGHLFVAVPSDKEDKVVFNSHRVYGPVMRSHLFANWDLVWSQEETLSDFDHATHQVTMAVLKKHN